MPTDVEVAQASFTMSMCPGVAFSSRVVSHGIGAALGTAFGAAGMAWAHLSPRNCMSLGEGICYAVPCASSAWLDLALT